MDDDKSESEREEHFDEVEKSERDQGRDSEEAASVAAQKVTKERARPDDADADNTDHSKPLPNDRLDSEN